MALDAITTTEFIEGKSRLRRTQASIHQERESIQLSIGTLKDACREAVQQKKEDL